MHPKLDKYLCDTFPKIYAERNLPETETCMCWGFACGDGWFWLLHELTRNIQAYIESNPEVEQVVAIQVKSKFGSLRFYCRGGDPCVDGMVTLAEMMSFSICESCGATVAFPSCERHASKPRKFTVDDPRLHELWREVLEERSQEGHVE